MSAVDALVEEYRFPEPLFVTRPTMPSRREYQALLDRIWESKWLTNDGPLVREFERRLAAHLKVEEASLFCNGTTALLVALHELGIRDGEVITTPFTFAATAHALSWSGIRPVFCDIDEETLTLDPAAMERLIGPETRGILPVHVYGRPCHVNAIEAIAEKHGLPVIYDGAHAFGVSYRGKSLTAYGDVTMLSFHATKPFSTLEGGALVSRSGERRERYRFLRNFGILDEETVAAPGINGKMNEFQAAYGLLQLENVNDEIGKRGVLTRLYRENLKAVPGLRCLDEMPEATSNYGFFPLFVDGREYGMTRDDLYDTLKRFNIMTRKYFYPLCSRYPCYSSLPSSSPEHLPVSEKMSRQVLCIPLFGDLPEESALRIAKVLEELSCCS